MLGDVELYSRIGVPRGFLSGSDHAAFHVLVARLAGENTTLEHARRRGLGTALTDLHAHDALARGCQTASLQSTEIAEHVYATVGFRDLGRILEYVPQLQRAPSAPPVRRSDTA